MTRCIKHLPLIALLLIPVPELLSQEATAQSPWPAMEQPETTDATSRKIIDLHLKARGGPASLKSFKGLKVTGELIEGKLDYQLEAVYRPPESLIVKTTRRHLGDDHVRAMATVGSSAWQQTMLPKRKLPGPMGGDEKDFLDMDAVIPFMFFQTDTDGHVFSYRGEVTFSGRKAYVLHGWLSNGHRVEALFDAETFHVINYRQVYRIGNARVIIDRVPMGLVRVDDTWWEKGYDFRLRGKTFRKISYEEVMRLPDPGTKLFQMPPTNERWLRGSSAN